MTEEQIKLLLEYIDSISFDAQFGFGTLVDADKLKRELPDIIEEIEEKTRVRYCDPYNDRS